MDLTCCHLRDFPAWALSRVTGDHGRVAVVSNQRIISANRPARRAGITPGMSLSRARSLGTAITFHTYDAGIVAAVWESALAELNALTPYLEDAGPGWAFLRAEAPALLDWRQRTGACVGLGMTRRDARLAALRAGTGHLLVVTPQNRGAFLRRFPVGPLAELGFEEEMLERLVLLGYGDLAACAGLTRRQLDAQFGAEGVRLYDLLHPEGEPPIGLYRPPPRVVERLDLDDPLHEPGEIGRIATLLVERAVDRLDGLRCGRVTLSIERRETGLRASRILKDPVADPRAINRAAAVLLGRVLREAGEVFAVVLELGSLTHGTAAQGSFFVQRPSLYSAVRRVHRRYPGSMRRAKVIPHALFHEEASYLEPFPEAAPTRRRRSRR